MQPTGQAVQKERRRLPIPDELRKAMIYADECIELAATDPDYCIDYDDAIQSGPVYGGRIGTERRPMEFTYSPTNDPLGEWYLNLHPIEVEDIADGVMTEILMYCCKSPICSFKFREPEEICPVCDVGEDGDDDFGATFTGL